MQTAAIKATKQLDDKRLEKPTKKGWVTGGAQSTGCAGSSTPREGHRNQGRGWEWEGAGSPESEDRKWGQKNQQGAECKSTGATKAAKS